MCPCSVVPKWGSFFVTRTGAIVVYVIFITQTAFRPGPHCLRTSPAFSEPWPIPRYGTVKCGKHSISYLGRYLWGEISQDISSKTSLGSFVGTVCNLDVSSLLDDSCNCCTCT